MTRLGIPNRYSSKTDWAFWYRTHSIPGANAGGDLFRIRDPSHSRSGPRLEGELREPSPYGLYQPDSRSPGISRGPLPWHIFYIVTERKCHRRIDSWLFNRCSLYPIHHTFESRDIIGIYEKQRAASAPHASRLSDKRATLKLHRSKTASVSQLRKWQRCSENWRSNLLDPFWTSKPYHQRPPRALHWGEV